MCDDHFETVADGRKNLLPLLKIGCEVWWKSWSSVPGAGERNGIFSHTIWIEVAESFAEKIIIHEIFLVKSLSDVWKKFSYFLPQSKMKDEHSFQLVNNFSHTPTILWLRERVRDEAAWNVLGGKIEQSLKIDTESWEEEICQVGSEVWASWRINWIANAVFNEYQFFH